MATLVYALNLSLDGFVDHDRFAPDPALFLHFVDDVAAMTGTIYGRRMYEIMRYWDDDRPEWTAAERSYAAAWRACPKWVVSGTLATVGPNAVLIANDVVANLEAVKAAHAGTIEVAGPALAASLMHTGLIDEYRMYLHPVVLGSGTPYFKAVPPPLRLTAHEPIGDRAIRLTYVPA